MKTLKKQPMDKIAAHYTDTSTQRGLLLNTLLHLKRYRNETAIVTLLTRTNPLVTEETLVSISLAHQAVIEGELDEMLRKKDERVFCIAVRGPTSTTEYVLRTEERPAWLRPTP